MTFVVGLTGGIASGKSTVGKLFVELGVSLVDADSIARDAVRPGSDGLSQVVQCFGPNILLASGELDRAAMRDLVFVSPDKRALLESIIHPIVRQDTKSQIAASTGHYCVVDVPLLVETGQSGAYHRVLVVDVSDTTQRERLKQRDSLDDDQIDAIIAAQATRHERLAIADDVIDNNGAAEALTHQVSTLHKKYLIEANALKEIQ